MAVYPAGRMDGLGFMPYRFAGNPMLWNTVPTSGGRYNPNTGETWSQTSAIPDGYSAGGAWALPIVAGGMSSWQSVIRVSGSGDLLSGGPMDGSATLSFIGDANLGLIISLSGTGSASFIGDANLSLTIGLAGTGAFGFTGDASLSMIVPIEGSGSFGINGLADLRGNLSMDGSWSPFTELSPQSLATAVWSALAAQNNEPGTMGDLLNAAGGGGISGAVIDQIADAVWDYIGTSPTNSKGDELIAALKAAKLAAALSA